MNVENSPLIEIRDGNEGDYNFIIATWLRGLKFGNNWYDLIDAKVYFPFYKTIINSLLSKKDAKVIVACLHDDPNVIIGYCVFDPQRVHWIHVKVDWRNIGVATKLFPKGVNTVSHLTEVAKSIFLKKKHLKFNPFLIL